MIGVGWSRRHFHPYRYIGLCSYSYAPNFMFFSLRTLNYTCHTHLLHHICLFNLNNLSVANIYVDYSLLFFNLKNTIKRKEEEKTLSVMPPFKCIQFRNLMWVFQFSLLDVGDEGFVGFLGLYKIVIILFYIPFSTQHYSINTFTCYRSQF